MKGTSSPNMASTKPRKIGVSKKNRSPITGKAAKMFHASRGKTMLKASTPRFGLSSKA